MKIPILNSCPDLADSIETFLNFTKKFRDTEETNTYFKNYETFENVTDGVVFIGLQKDSLSYPVLTKDYGKNILYVYIENEPTIAMNRKGCEITMSEKRPKYFIIIPKFKQLLDIMVANYNLNNALKPYEKQMTKEGIINSINIWYNKNYNLITKFIEMKNENNPIPPAPEKPNFKPSEFKSPEDNDLPMVINYKVK